MHKSLIIKYVIQQDFIGAFLKRYRMIHFKYTRARTPPPHGYKISNKKRISGKNKKNSATAPILAMAEFYHIFLKKNYFFTQPNSRCPVPRTRVRLSPKSLRISSATFNNLAALSG